MREKEQTLNTQFLENRISLIASLSSIIMGIAFGWYIMFLANPADSFAGMGLILSGGLSNGIAGIGQTYYVAAPIIMTGLSVGFAFKTNLFNIGASGQFTVGGFAAIFIGIKCSFLPGVLPCVAAITGAMLAGAVWGFIPGVLKAYFKVNEVISGIMLNYAGMLLVNLLIKNTVFDSTTNGTLPVPRSAQLVEISEGSRLNLGIFIALVFVIVIAVLLNKTTFGYELKICGKNNFAGLYAGINDKRSVILSLTIAGALAGVGGALMFLSDFGAYIGAEDIVLEQGFTGISVALLGLSNPVGILFAGLFIGHITVGGGLLQLYGFTPDVVNMITAVIIYCGAFTIPLKAFLRAYIKGGYNKRKEARA